MPITPATATEELPPETEEAEVSEDASATLDIGILGGKPVAAGDRVELEVVSVDEDSGTLTVKYPKPEKTTGSSIEAATAVFDEEPSTASRR